MARLLWADPFWEGKRKPFVTAITMTSQMIILMFLALLCYLYGSLWKSGERASGLNVLAVDYDGGVIGQSLTAAYESVRGKTFPTLHFRPAADFETVEDVRNAVCRGDYWAAVFAHDGASERLAAALSGGPPAAQYEADNTITYVYNAIHYPAVQSGFIVSNMQTLIGVARQVYNSLNGTAAAAYLNTDDRNATLALLNPISASTINIKPSDQGTKVLYNTVTMVLPIIQQFFFLMAINGISTQFGIYGYLHSHQVGIIRMIVSTLYTFLASLTHIGYIWAFREGWDVSGNQFVLAWIATWLYMHVNFLILDAATALIPVSFLSFFVLPWVIINVTSTIYPFELSPGFYRWNYAIPGHQLISIWYQIWSGGCNNQLARALPVLLGWELFGGAAAIFGTFYRNKAARRAVLSEEGKQSSLATGEGESPEARRKTADNPGPVGWPYPFSDAVYPAPKLRRTGTV
ncbi:hypothetical protein PZA11_005057 [Diplocarpon coronariae]